MKDFIKIKNLILFSNKGERNLIDIPNLQFDSKSISVIIGPNGAGKSLLLNLIQGLILPSAGIIKIKSSIKDKKLQKVSIMMQKPSFLKEQLNRIFNLF